MFAYYDGAHDEKCQQALTLSGLAAPESVWADFEDDWDKALESHHIYEDLHMRELMHNEGYFANIGLEEKRELIISLFNVFGKYSDTRMRAYSCTVLLPGYEQAKVAIKNLREPAVTCPPSLVQG